MDYLKQLKILETEALALEPSLEDRQTWEEEMVNYSEWFLTQVKDLPAYSSEGQAYQALSFQDDARSIQEVLDWLRPHVDQVGINPASNRHFGYIPGGGVFATAVGDYLAAVTNRYAGMYFAGPGAVKIENEVIRWLCDLIGYGPQSLGNLTSGGSIANLIAVHTARERAQLQPERFREACIYVTDQTHHCLDKALWIAGLRDAQIRRVEMDEQLRMSPVALERAIQTDIESGLFPFMIVGSAGTTNTGAIDPLAALADLAERFKIWFHVDAAYGGAFLLVDDLRPDFAGIERSDSVTLDPHKGFFLAYGSGAILMRDVQDQYTAHSSNASYLQDAQESLDFLSPADLSPELTKHFRGLRFWMALQLHGVKPFRAALQEKYVLCQYAMEQLKQFGFQVGPTPQLSVGIFRVHPPGMTLAEANALNKKALASIWADGQFFLSSTTIDGVFWVRIAIMSFRSHLKEIDGLLEVLKRAFLEVPASSTPD